jgi:hypothetical protein
LDEDQFSVNIFEVLTGVCLGTLKVRQTTKLIDVHSKLIAAMGSVGFAFETKLVQGTTVWDEPYGSPFYGAIDGASYGVMKIRQTNVIYVDHQRRLNKEMKT